MLLNIENKASRFRLTYRLLIVLLFVYLPFVAFAGNNFRKPLSASPVKSVVDSVMANAPFYSNIIHEFHSDMYIKARLQVIKKNLLYRYLPHIFSLRKNERDYLLETFTNLHYLAPNVYDQHIQAQFGTVDATSFQNTLLDYMRINVYAETLQNKHFFSPVAPSSRRYYNYELDSVKGQGREAVYYITFKPRSKSEELVRGHLVITARNWTVKKMDYSGRYQWMTFTSELDMGKPDELGEYMPVKSLLKIRFNFMGNIIDGVFNVDMKYKFVRYRLANETALARKEGRYNLSHYYKLTQDTTQARRDSIFVASVRPQTLTAAEDSIYKKYSLYTTANKKKQTRSKQRTFWGDMGDFLLYNQSVDVSHLGDIRCTPIINPLLFDYSGRNGLSWQQDFKFSSLFSNDRLLRIVPALGYNFTRKSLIASLNTNFEYWPERRGSIACTAGEGNFIYNSDMLDELKKIPDSIVDLSHVHLDNFRDFYVDFSHSVELLNGLELYTGVAYHRRSAVEKSKIILLRDDIPALKEYVSRFRNTYVSFAPQIRLSWTPGMYYYMSGKRKINYGSKYPTFSVDYERGLKGVLNSTGEYERVEVDVQQQISFGLVRKLIYRVGFGAFTNSDELYFVDFANLSKGTLLYGWNDDIAGSFQLMNGRFYKNSKQYIHAHVSYETPFLLLNNLLINNHFINKERLYFNTMIVPKTSPYIEAGYGIGTSLFNLAAFLGCESWKNVQFGWRFSFSLFNY